MSTTWPLPGREETYINSLFNEKCLVQRRAPRILEKCSFSLHINELSYFEQVTLSKNFYRREALFSPSIQFNTSVSLGKKD